MDSWEMQMERAKADAKRPFHEKHPRLTVVAGLLFAAVVFGGVLATLRHFLG